MKPFSLDIVLDYRQRLEDTAKNKLFKTRQERDEIIEKIRLKKELYSQTLTNIEQLKKEPCSILDLIQAENQISFTKQQINELKTILINKEGMVQRALTNLTLRSKEKQVLEKLKEKQNDEWKKYLSKKEAAMLDEIAILRHSR